MLTAAVFMGIHAARDGAVAVYADMAYRPNFIRLAKKMPTTHSEICEPKRALRKSPATLRWFELRDLPYCFILPLLWGAARIVPERLWPEFCDRLVNVLFLGPRFIGRSLSRRIREATRDWPIKVDPDDICQDYVSQKLIMQLQYFASSKPGGWEAKIRLSGQEHLQRALADGHGAILWTTSSGSSALVVKRCLAEQGFDVFHLSDTTHGYSTSRFGVRFINSVNRTIEDRYVAERVFLDRRAPQLAVHRLLQLLRGNRIVSITAMENPGGNNVEAPVFGCRVPIGVGAIQLARRTGAALLPVFCCLLPSGEHAVMVEEPLPQNPAEKLDDFVQLAAQEFGRRTESYVSKFPSQWNGWQHIETSSKPDLTGISIWDWIHKRDYARRFDRSGRVS